MEKHDFSELELIEERDVTKYLKLRVFKNKNNELMFDIRNYYKGKPTKKGIRISEPLLKSLILKDL